MYWTSFSSKRFHQITFLKLKSKNCWVEETRNLQEQGKIKNDYKSVKNRPDGIDGNYLNWRERRTHLIFEFLLFYLWRYLASRQTKKKILEQLKHGLGFTTSSIAPVNLPRGH